MQRLNTLRSVGAVCGSTVYPATGPLVWNTLLLQASGGHSSDMARNNYFSHTSLDGRIMEQRVQAAGYAYTALGENIAAGQTTAQSVIATWTNSPGHCRNLMNPVYRDVAVACVRSDASNYGYYWTMNLGRPAG
ncbi:MAG: CAP domain-containing protein [Rhodoferax sp.]|nr:CAP domain-containing protein [Rhodoferax sp.]